MGTEKGLFDSVYKQPIPKYPKAIGVLTSPTGAAVRDIIHIVNRRFPLTNIIVYPTLVQGEYAKDSIVKQIKKANKDELVDVIILGRGGGSIEDLWPFNEEEVAYAIFESKLPIISSVGHETDFTISDFVSDLRAPTPSGGAEIAVPNQVDLLQYIGSLKERLNYNINHLVKRKSDILRNIEQSVVFRDPYRLTEKQTQQLLLLDEKLQLLSPKNKLDQYEKDLLNLRRRLENIIQKRVDYKRNQFDFAVSRLELLNPLSIMKKGYSVTMKNNEIIKSVEHIQQDEVIDVRFHDGQAKAKVLEIERMKK